MPICSVRWLRGELHRIITVMRSVEGSHSEERFKVELPAEVREDSSATMRRLSPERARYKDTLVSPLSHKHLIRITSCSMMDL